MRIADSFAQNRPVCSFEFFPPKTDDGVKNLLRTIADLGQLDPSFVSVTYGAGGTTRDLTVDLVARIKREIGLEAMAHLTCVGHSAAEIGSTLDRLQQHGIENVLALRGDPPQGETEFVRPSDGFAYAQELVRFIRAGYGFCLGGACHPEGHVECVSKEEDLRHLKDKTDAGVDFLITQLFFDPSDYFRFVSDARAIGVLVPILPGIMPVTNVGQIERFTAKCGARIPPPLQDRLNRVRDDEAAVVSVGVKWATQQALTLLEGGAPGVHFFTLNRSTATRQVFENLRARHAV